ncbi:MAG: ATPase, T2SS/T4P/T4SS family [Candidatus Cloacimonadales bacterium]|jgi:type IV pilus assembly protein PilB|nr:ATPase, T2SS/T4P/T4SS family [Candidatus Cloacimonadales bacterium]
MIEKSRLGYILTKKKIISEDQLAKALEQQKLEGASGRKLGQILVEDFGIDHHQIFSTLAEIYAFRSATIEPSKLEPAKIQHTKDLLKRFNESLKNELVYKKVLPFHANLGPRGNLIVLAADVTEKVVEKIPLNTEFKRYEVVYCPLKTLDELIQMFAPQKNEFLDILQEATESTITDTSWHEENINEGELDEEINKSLLVNLFEGCLLEAVRKGGVSDVHIIPYQKNAVDIYFRVDGKLQLWHRQEHTSPEAMAAVVKDRTNGVDRFERDGAQDGFAQRVVDGHLIRFRVSIIPIVSAEFERRFESIVIRVIDDRNVIADLKKLGFQEKAEHDFLKAISVSQGMVLVTGPTGSGKSTTLMAALFHTMDPSKNVLTCEDPVEYVIQGARQIKISHRLSFDQAIRAILRHDPDIVLVGEIRDKITADIGVKLANTGHLTLSTLHTNDAVAAVSRLFKMGVEPFLIANVINIIVAQRLVRKICPECCIPLPKEKYNSALDLGLTMEDIEKGLILDPGPGCKKCNRGYKGRVNICEALYFSPAIKKAVLESGNDIDEYKILEIAEGQGMLSLRESGLDRIRNGLTSLEEIIYATSED